MALHKITRDINRSLACGPTAVAAVTGLPASRILSTFDDQRGNPTKSNGVKKGIRGVHRNELIAVLQTLGFTVEMRDRSDRPTVAQYISNMTDNTNRILHVGFGRGGHYVALDGSEFCDPFTRQPIPVDEAPRRRAQVIREFLIT